MQGITKGTVLGGRYELTTEISDAPGLARWIARDEKLGREVAVTAFPAASAVAAAALDSARRAAGVEDSRLVRVLDAGTSDGVAFVVEEAHTGAHTLADLVRFEPMHPEEARRIVGEVASALEAARARGLHHLILTPSHVLRLADGSIAVTQVAVGSALAGLDDISSSEATKLDTRRLIDLLYLALTAGDWPGDPEDVKGAKGIRQAERRADGQVASPSELVDGIPGDLDTLCRSTLNHDQGPRTPGEVARQLAPWSAQMITAPGKPRRDVSDADGSDGATTANGADPDYTVRRASETARPREGVGAVGAAALAAAGAGADKVGRTTTSDDDTDPGLGSGGTGATAAQLPRKAAPRRPVADPDPADATMIGRPVQFDADETTQFSLDDEDAAYTRTSYDPSFEELEPPVPGFAGGTDDPDPGSSKLALGIVALFVVLALALAALGLKGLGGSSKEAGPASTGAPSSAGASSSNKSSGQGSSSSSTTAADIVGATFINDRGLRRNETVSVARAVDGNPDTAWTSLHYLNQPWGGFRGYGGLAIKLNQTTDVKAVTITPADGYPLTADVYVGDTPGTGGTKIGSVSDITSKDTVSGSAKGRYVTIFITKQDKAAGKDYYQSSISEVSVGK